MGRPVVHPTVPLAALAAWLGFVLHNAADLPGSPITAPEYVVPTAIWAALLLAWAVLPGRRGPALPLFGWTLLNVVGAIVTVLPLAALPFSPEQSARHYLFHALYLATQLPLLAALWPAIRGATPAGRGADRGADRADPAEAPRA